jgi:hypothetical protein
VKKNEEGQDSFHLCIIPIPEAKGAPEIPIKSYYPMLKNIFEETDS